MSSRNAIGTFFSALASALALPFDSSTSFELGFAPADAF
jgi:hypothetical protein